jgi:hypothetical protein
MFVPETAAERTVARPSRCANHPGLARAALCSRCRRPLCISCAVPVRGTVFGPECLPEVLEDAPPLTERPHSRIPLAHVLCVVGFGLVAGLSALPWSRFGDASGILEAWRVHWSLLAVAAATAGFVASLVFWRRPTNPRTEVAVCLPLALLVIGAAFLHRLHPPSLSSASAVPLLAALAGVVALAGVGLEALAWLRGR